MNVYKFTQLDVESLTIQNPQKIGKIFYSKLHYDSNPVVLQTPRMKLVTDVSVIDSKKQPFIECEIMDTTFLHFLKSIDQSIKDTIYQSCKDWFSKDIPKEAVNEMYKKIVKSQKIRIRLPVVSNEIQWKAFNEDNVYLDTNEIKKGMELIGILHFRGIKFLSGNCICDFYMNQCKVFTKPSMKYILPDACLIENDNYESDDDIIDQEYLQEVQKQEKRNQLILEKQKELSELARLSERIKSLENDIQKI
jgi:hypothetical protein